jgi:transposase
MAPNLAVATHELTESVIKSKLQGDRGPTDEQTARIARCSARTIRRHRRNVLLYGSTKAPSNGAGRHKSVKPPMRSALHDKLAIKPSMRLKDMVTFLSGEFEVELSRHSIRRELRHGTWSKKVTQNVAQERNADLRDDYMHEVSSFRSDQLVFLDESGLDKSIMIHTKGWAPRGKRPRQVKRFHRGLRYQILPAYTQDGVIHFRVFTGSTDTEIFENFIEELLPYCGRWPNKCSVLVMDNASIHRSDKIQQMCDGAGVILLFLPPYSPDLNPIEEMFGELKTYIKQVWEEHIGFVRADFLGFLEECVSVVGARKASARGHFRRSGISVDELE